MKQTMAISLAVKKADRSWGRYGSHDSLLFLCWILTLFTFSRFLVDSYSICELMSIMGNSCAEGMIFFYNTLTSGSYRFLLLFLLQCSLSLGDKGVWWGYHIKGWALYTHLPSTLQPVEISLLITYCIKNFLWWKTSQ